MKLKTHSLTSLFLLCEVHSLNAIAALPIFTTFKDITPSSFVCSLIYEPLILCLFIPHFHTPHVCLFVKLFIDSLVICHLIVCSSFVCLFTHFLFVHLFTYHVFVHPLHCRCPFLVGCCLSIHWLGSVFHFHSFIFCCSIQCPNNSVMLSMGLLFVSSPYHTPLHCGCLFLVGCYV